MNYLAHAYLSFHHPEILVGNMISDFIKGKKQFDYPLTVQKGIRLHRAIDTFTDEHAATKEAKAYLKPAVGAYAGALTDVVYDHFLALDKNEFPSTALETLAAEVYTQLSAHEALLPERFGIMLPYMIRQNWLYNYQFTGLIEKSFQGVAKRAKYLTGTDAAFGLFITHYQQLQELYTHFFPDVKKFTQQRFTELLSS